MTRQGITYVVLFQRELDEDTLDGRLQTEDECIQQLAREIQSGFDSGELAGNFLVISRHEGDAGFWQQWNARAQKAVAKVTGKVRHG